MSEQNYSNHVRYYTPHHFVFYPVAAAILAFCVYNAFSDEGNERIWIALSAITAIVTWLSFMLRQHYALTLQNRLVLLELHYRYHVITGQRLEDLESQLKPSQLFALRFASDSELAVLVVRAAQEKLSADEIKKAISHWKADNMRV